MLRTTKIKLPQNKSLIETLNQGQQIYDFITAKGYYDLQTVQKQKLHNHTYSIIRKVYPNVPSALIQTIRDTAIESLKSTNLNTLPIQRNKNLRYDSRTISYHPLTKQISLSTINGRKKFLLNIPKYFQNKYINKGYLLKSAVLTERSKQLYISLIFENNQLVEPYRNNQVLGIDRGINNIAVTSNNIFFNSKQHKNIKGKYQYLKSTLQSQGTSSAKRKLKQISGKEKRFTKDLNHQISKQIAAQDYGFISIEDLKHIRNSNRGKWFNRKLGNWSFNQLENFLDYKLEELGKQLIKINPKYTSQTCSRCDHKEKANRSKHRFKCKNCGYELNADLNAAKNIANLGISQISRLLHPANCNQPS